MQERPGFDSWVRKIPWRRKWQPIPVFLPGESHGQRSLAGYGPCGHKESDTSEGLTTGPLGNSPVLVPQQSFTSPICLQYILIYNFLEAGHSLGKEISRNHPLKAVCFSSEGRQTYSLGPLPSFILEAENVWMEPLVKLRDAEHILLHWWYPWGR